MTTVRAHPRRVPVSSKNPSGITIVDRHPRQLPGSSLDAQGIRSITASRDRRGLIYPSDDKLGFRNGDKYDEIIAIWVDYFNERFAARPPGAPLDPDAIKALIASESGFEKSPRTPQAIGIAQITPETLKILLNPAGEAKDFTFHGIRAEGKLGRGATPEEIVLEYKGLLKSKSDYQERALRNFRENYAILKKK